MSGGAAPLLVARELAVDGPQGPLLAPSSFVLREGERALLVGPSGAGKSLLLDVVLGFVPGERAGLAVRGSLVLDGRELVGAPVEARDGRVGAVFQLQASGLFDDLSAAQNLDFGSPDRARAAALAGALGLADLERPVPLLSGGQQVRLAVARALLRDPLLLVADEPTTGLDAAAAAQAVQALREAHRRLTLVVTHDEAAFEGFADARLVLDPATRTITRRDAGAPAAAAPSALPLPPAPPAPLGPVPSVASPPRGRLGARLERALLATGDGLLDLLGMLRLPRALADLGHRLHGPRARAALARALAPGVATFVGVAAVLVALTATFFLFERLPRRELSEPLLQEDLLRGLGVILTRVVVPLVSSILLAAKLGASVAAHLGHLTRSRQVDALRLLGVGPRRHLLEPQALALLLAAWWHTALALLLAAGTTVVVFLVQHPGWSARYAWRAFVHGVEGGDLLWVAAKCGVGALLVALTAYRCATAPKRSPADVLAALHRTLLVGLLLVLATHAACAFLEF